ncbi:hypothetical protein [Cohnella sp. AR92]|uniref:hypothetical protein n=1 Tax=Cohnella sp. AR92 TaxID=648716 RepID=UPI000F8C9294|nr:hypothetical protein [Cohnella sp. AR92]RUS45033.1 hypothetical protein ELR57_21070 [Cohnella sp. AR92]
MKIKDLAFVLVRILALYAIVQGVGQLANLFQLLYFQNIAGIFTSLSAGLFILTFVACALVYFLAGWLLWSQSGKLVRYMTRGMDAADSPQEDNSNSVALKEWYTLGLTLVGIVLAAWNIPSLIGHIVQLIQYAADEVPSAFASARRQTWIQIVADVLKLAIALVLIFRADGIAGLVRRIRELGAKGEQQTEWRE